MDALDLRLLRQMGLHPFEPWSQVEPLRTARLARGLGVTEKTVRERLRRLEEQGVLAGYEIHPNLLHLALDWTTFHYRVATRQKAKALASIADVEGVVAIQDHVGEDVFVELYYANEDEMRLRTRLLKTLLGEGFLDWYDHEMPPVRRALSPLDWRIVAALRGNARRPAADVAKELGITARTAERRIAAMIAGRDAYVVPRIDWSRGPQLLPFSLVVKADATGARKVARLAPRLALDCCRLSWAPTCCDPGEGGTVQVALYASSAREMEELRRQFAALDGVTAVHVLLPAQRHEPREWLDALIRRFAVGAGAGTTATPVPATLPNVARTRRR